jgi:iron complex transport system substrate-binding protein
LTGIGLLGACSSGPTPGGDNSPNSAATHASRTVTDAEGTTMTVPAQPERVIVLSEPTLDGALALGVTPIGTLAGRGQSTAPAYLGQTAAQIPLIGSIAQPNYEAIGAAAPDLILVDGTSINNNPDAIAILRAIAPTFYAGYAGGNWRTTFEATATALGLTDRARDVLADYDAHVAATRAQLTDYASTTFSIVRWQGGGASLILGELPAGQALTDLGLARPPAQSGRGRGHSEPVSTENLDQIDADYMFFGTIGGASVSNPDAGGATDTAEAARALTQAVELPGFTDLQAYQAGRIILVDGSSWTSTGGPMLMKAIVDDVREALIPGA